MSSKKSVLLLALLVGVSCSPRDFLTRRLAADLIAACNLFKAPQNFVLQTGVVSGKEYPSPEFLVLQRHGWISAGTAPCPPGLVPPPCWDILLTPSGVDTVRTILPVEETTKPSFTIAAARRELIAITGISKQGTVADVEFTWKWMPLNEIGAALYSPDVHYRSTTAFRDYDDGWRVVETTRPASQSLDEGLKNAEPEP
jgi:hypothetical protein